MIRLTEDLLLSLELPDSAGLVSLELPALSPPPPTHAALAGHESVLLAPIQPVWRYLGSWEVALV